MSADASNTRRSGEGFVAEVTGAEARRQLRMSIAVVSMIAGGIASAAFVAGPSAVPARHAAASTRPVTVLHAETGAVGARAI